MARRPAAVRFYELNPLMMAFNKEFFTYIDESLAQVTNVMGDARISLERELTGGHNQQFDLLALDAFSGDAIPPADSADHYDLSPVVRGLALDAGMGAIRFSNNDDAETGAEWSVWIVATRDPDFLNDPDVRRRARRWNGPAENSAVWTDDDSNLFDVLR